MLVIQDHVLSFGRVAHENTSFGLNTNSVVVVLQLRSSFHDRALDVISELEVTVDIILGVATRYTNHHVMVFTTEE